MTPPLPTLHRTAVPLLLGLGVFLFFRGLLPAWTRMDTDFPNYYTAGSIVLAGGDAARLYDDSWFRDELAARGFSREGKFSPFPPATALVCAPLALVAPQTSLRILTAVNLAALAMCILLLARVEGMTLLPAALLVLVAGQGLANAFRFGQLYILMSLCITAGWLAARGGRRFAGGLLLGLFIPVKYYPVAFLPWYIARREWRTVLGMLTGAGAVAAAGLLALGPAVHGAFVRDAAGDHLRGQLSLQDPFSHSFQSFGSLLRRLFVPDPSWNPAPLVDAPAAATVLLVAATGTVLALLVYSLRRPDDTSWALWGIGALLLAPATATYHMVLLWLPAALLMSAREDGPARKIARWIVPGAVAVIGFLPMTALRALDGGWTTPLAYPRLALLAVLFAAGLFLHATGRTPVRENPSTFRRIPA